MKSFRFPRSRRVERLKLVVRSTLLTLTRLLPLPPRLQNGLKGFVLRNPLLKYRWTEPKQPPQ